MSSESWQPIETAPKDGTRLLVFSPVDGVVSSHWEGGTWQGLPWRAPHNAAKAAPTYWMPLPLPPEPSKGLSTGDAARIDSHRIDAIERLQVAITPVEGGGWDASVFDHDNERLIFSGRDVRAAMDGALTALAGQQQGGTPE